MKLLRVLAPVLVVIVQCFNLHRLYNHDAYMRTVICQFVALTPSTEGVDEFVPFSWVGFVPGFLGTDIAAWYTWATVAVAGSLVCLMATAIKDLGAYGVGDAAGGAVVVATLSFLLLLGSKFAWLLVSVGTGWRLALGVVLGCGLLIVAVGIVGFWKGDEEEEMFQEYLKKQRLAQFEQRMSLLSTYRSVNAAHREGKVTREKQQQQSDSPPRPGRSQYLSKQRLKD